MNDLFRAASVAFDRILFPIALSYEGITVLSHNFGSPDFRVDGAELSVVTGGVACLALAANLALGNIRLISCKRRPHTPGLG